MSVKDAKTIIKERIDGLQRDQYTDDCAVAAGERIKELRFILTLIQNEEQYPDEDYDEGPSDDRD